jgi:gliding motility-associated-like protein
MNWGISNTAQFCVRLCYMRGGEGISKSVLLLIITILFFIAPKVSKSQLDGGQVGSSQCINAGATPVSFTSVVAASGPIALGYTVLGYQWESSSSSNFSSFTTVTNISVNNDIYSPGVLNSTTYFRRRAYSAYTIPAPGLEDQLSNTIVISIKPVVTGISPITPTICLGQTSFPVTLFVTNSPTEFKIDWGIPAVNNGFNNVLYAANNFPNSGLINVTVPGTATSTTYFGTLTLRSAITASGITNYCESDPGTAPFQINPLPTINGTLSVCVGLTTALTGSATAAASNPWVSSNIAIATVDNNGLVTGVSAGTAIVTYTNTNGCSQTVTITVNTIPSTPSVSNNGAICAGTTLQLTGPSVTGATYSWTGPNGFSSSSQSPSILNATTAASGTYSLTVSVNGCISTAGTTNAIVNAIPSTPSVSNNGAICAGTTLQLTGPSVTGATYSWTGPNGFSSSSQSPSILNATTAASGTYSLTVSVNGCVSTAGTTNAIVNVIPSTPSVSNNGAICAGTTLQLTGPSVTGATYSWTGPNGFSSSSQSPSILNATTAASGTYSLTVSMNGCVSTAGTTNAIVNAIPSITITNPSAVCSPLTVDLTSTNITTGSTAGLTYTQWTNAIATTVLSNPNAVAASGTYYIKGTTAASCSAIQPVTVTINALPTVTITNPSAVCSPSTVDLTSTNITTGSTAGLTYTQWTNAGATIALSNPSAVAASGTYYIKGTTAAGCSLIQSVTVTINAFPTVTITNPSAVCSPSTVDLTSTNVTTGSTAGLTYTQWTDVGATIALSNPNAVAASGTYYIKGTTAASCSVIQSVTVTINALPTVTITNPSAVCSPLTVDLTSTNITTGSTAGLTYTQWTNAIATTVLSNPNAVAASGIYYIKGTTAASCSVTQPVTVTINALPTVTITNPSAVCSPATVDLTSTNITTGSTAGLTYTQWTDAGATTAVSNPNAVAASGTYYIKGTTAASCSVTQPVTITVNPLPSATITTSGPTNFCVGGTVTLTAPGGNIYLWNTGANSQSILISNSGNYSVTITNASGCSVVTTPTAVTVNSLPVAGITASGPTSFCAGGTVTLTASTGSTYLWSNGAVTQSIVVNSSGNYSVTITNASGCSASAAAMAVTVNPLPVATITAIGPATFCAGGSLTLTASAATNYLWSNGAVTQSIVVNSSGNYTVQVSNLNGCTSVSSITPVTVNALPVASITTNGSVIFCYGGSVDLSASTGVSYLWNTGTNTQNLTVSGSGNYFVTVTNAAGCAAKSAPVTVTVNPSPNLLITNPAAVCSPGTIDLTATGITAGSTAGLIFTRWADAAATVPLTNANAVSVSGTYYIKGTTVANCSIIQPVVAAINPLPVISITDPSACTPLTVDLTSPLITAGSTGGLLYSVWTNAAATNVLVNVVSVAIAGTYYLKGTDPVSGCSAVKPVNVSIYPSPVITVNSPQPVCAPGTVNLNSPAIISGNISGLTITHWRDPSTTLPVNNVTAVNSSGTYYVKATTVNGCSVVQPVSLSILPQPLINITNPAPVCTPATVNLVNPSITSGSSAGTNFTYWRDSATTQVLLTPTTVASSGTYYIKGILPTGCSSSQAVIVTIKASPVIAINTPSPVCEPATIDVTAAAITAGSSSANGFTYWTDAANTNPLINPAAITLSGTYYITGTGTNGCSASLPVTVTINPLPIGSWQTPAVNYVCDGLSQLLTASNAFGYQWYLNQKLIPGATAATYPATTSGNYTVQFISKEGCIKNAGNTLRLDLLTRPNILFTALNRCVGLPVSFTNNSSFASSGGISWSWDFGDGSSSNNFSTQHTFTTPGNYTVTLTANNASCPNLTEKNTLAYTIELPLPGVRYDTVNAVSGKSFVLDARAFGVSYIWQPSAGLNNAFTRSPVGNISQDAAYTVAIKSAGGCITTDTVFVKLKNDGEIYVPQGFTPNGDGVNDKAYPILVGIRQLNYFKIFNRWGNLVFQTNDATPQNGWDGKIGGKIQLAGTYTWIAEGIDGNGNIIRRSGSILMIN